MISWKDEFGDRLSGRRVLVTGATGFLGWHLCAAFDQLGCEVFGLARGATSADLPGACAPLAVDLTVFDDVARTLRSLEPAIVCHAAGLVTGDRSIDLVAPMVRQNLVGAVNLFLAAKQAGCGRVVHIGSSEELAGDAPAPGPTSPYAAAKRAATLYASLFHDVYDLPVVTVQPFLMFGSRQAPEKLIPYVIRSLLEAEAPRIGNGERLCDFVYVQDVVRGIVKAALAADAAGQVIQLGSGQALAVREIVGIVAELMESAVAPVFDEAAGRAGEVASVADGEKARELLQWQPVWPLRQALEETVRWYREA